MLSNRRFRDLLAYTRKRTRSATDLFFVDGWRWLEEALGLPEPPACVVAASGAARSPREDALLARARETAAEFVEASDEQVARLAQSVTSPGVVTLVRWRPVEIEQALVALAASGQEIVLVLDGVADPGNAGTLIRSADWFGAAAVVMAGASVDPTNAKVVRATMGSLFRLPVVVTRSLAAALARLRSAGFSIAAATPPNDVPGSTAWAPRTALIIGNEAHGVDRGVLVDVDFCVTIPRHGHAESLNAAVAGSILLADWRRNHTTVNPGRP